MSAFLPMLWQILQSGLICTYLPSYLSQNSNFPKGRIENMIYGCRACFFIMSNIQPTAMGVKKMIYSASSTLLDLVCLPPPPITSLQHTLQSLTLPRIPCPIEPLFTVFWLISLTSAAASRFLWLAPKLQPSDDTPQLARHAFLVPWYSA